MSRNSDRFGLVDGEFGPSTSDHQLPTRRYGSLSMSSKDSPEGADHGDSRIIVDRSALDQATFDTLYRESENCSRPVKEKTTLVEKAQRTIKDNCTCNEFGRFWIRRFPCLDWLGHYNIKKDLLADIIAGFTIAIFQVPQGMAYAMLANVPPVYGLYTSFFPVLIYALMGTSRQASIGTFAITSLMTGVLVERYSTPSPVSNSTRPGNETTSSDYLVENELGDVVVGLTPIQVASAVALVCGILQILFGVFRLGSLAVFLSEHLVSGFTCGSAIHVLSSQVKTIFGVSLKASDSGFLGLVYLYAEFFSVIHKSNVVTLGLSASTLVILIFFKEFINLKTKKWTPVPFPIELLLVVASTLASRYIYLMEDHGVRIVGHIEQGFPSPSLPPMETLLKVAGGCVALSIVGFSSTVSLSKIFAAKYNYEIDPNQETIALGSANLVGSLFSCIPCSASISRSSVQDGAGARTQLVSLINCAGLLVVLLALGSLLEPLPNCVLSCIIVVSLKGMVLLSKDFWVYWKRSKVDGAIWMVTFVAVLFLDVDLGLVVGLAFALLTLIYRTVRPKGTVKGYVEDTELFASIESYRGATELPDTRILHFGGPLHFANADYLSEKVCRLARLDQLRKQEKRASKSDKKKPALAASSLNSISPIIMADVSGEEFGADVKRTPLTLIILDCSAISYVDLAGLKTLRTLVKDLKHFGIDLYFANCSSNFLSMVSREEVFSDKMSTHFFPSLSDALCKHSRVRDEVKDIRVVDQ